MDYTGDKTSWPRHWLQDGGGDSVAPSLSRIVPRQEFNVTAYSDKFWYNAVQEIVGRINSDSQFLATYSDLRSGTPGVTPKYLVTDIGSNIDKGNWLLANASINRAGDRAFHYTFQWLHSPLGWGNSSGWDGWNHPYGVSVSTYMYGWEQFFKPSGLLHTLGRPGIIQVPSNA